MKIHLKLRNSVDWTAIICLLYFVLLWYLLQLVNKVESGMFQELHVDRVIRQLRDRFLINADQRKRFQDENGKMLN